MNLWEDINSVEITIASTALRFDGHKYTREQSILASDLIDHFLEDLKMFDNLLDNFAVFYFLQRREKWCELGAITNSSWKAYMLLFLQLYDKEVPEHYRREEEYKRWQTDYLPVIDKSVEIVRKCYERIVAFERKIATYPNARINKDGELEIYDPQNTSDILFRYYYSGSGPPMIEEKNDLTKKRARRDLTRDKVQNIKSGKGIDPIVVEYFKALGCDVW